MSLRLRMVSPCLSVLCIALFFFPERQRLAPSPVLSSPPHKLHVAHASDGYPPR